MVVSGTLASPSSDLDPARSERQAAAVELGSNRPNLQDRTEREPAEKMIAPTIVLVKGVEREDREGRGLLQKNGHPGFRSISNGSTPVCTIAQSRCARWTCAVHGPKRALLQIRGLTKVLAASSTALAITVTLDKSTRTWQDARREYKRIVRAMRSVRGDLEYLVVVEAHETGQLHLHLSVFVAERCPSLWTLRERIASAAGISPADLPPDPGKGLVGVTVLPDAVHRVKGQSRAEAVRKWIGYSLKNYESPTVEKHLELNGGRPFHYSKNLRHHLTTI